MLRALLREVCKDLFMAERRPIDFLSVITDDETRFQYLAVELMTRFRLHVYETIFDNSSAEQMNQEVHLFC